MISASAVNQFGIQEEAFKETVGLPCGFNKHTRSRFVTKEPHKQSLPNYQAVPERNGLLKKGREFFGPLLLHIIKFDLI
jgi:hypothetical protein